LFYRRKGHTNHSLLSFGGSNCAICCALLLPVSAICSPYASTNLLTISQRLESAGHGNGHLPPAGQGAKHKSRQCHSVSIGTTVRGCLSSKSLRLCAKGLGRFGRPRLSCSHAFSALYERRAVVRRLAARAGHSLCMVIVGCRWAGAGVEAVSAL
jgi:hypothetical protein